MSIGGFDIVSKIRNLLNFGHRKDNSLKRRANEQPEYLNLTKYRRVSNEFPKIINKPFDDDRLFMRPKHNFNRLNITQNRTTNSMMDSSKVKMSSLIPSYADLEYSDDEGKSIFSTSRKPLAQSSTNKSTYNSDARININNRFASPSADILKNKSKIYNIPLNIADRERKPLPPLIEAKTGIMTGCVPNLNPIRKNAFNSTESMNGLINTNSPPKRNAFAFALTSFDQPMTNGFGEPKNIFCAKNSNSLIASTYNLKEKQRYSDLLAKLVPTLYKPNRMDHDSERLSRMRNVRRLSVSNRPRPKVEAVLNLIDDDEQHPEEFIDLCDDDIQIISACQKTMIEKKKFEKPKKELPYVEPVNSLKDKDLTPTLHPQWLEKFREKYTERTLFRQKQISEEEENVRKLSSETEQQERLIEQRLKNFMIDTETIILDESEPEAEIEFPEFTNEDKEFIKRSIYRGPADEVLVSKFNMNITRRDVNTLVGDSWLNDEVINFYMNLLMERGEVRSAEGLPRVYAMNTFFIPRLMQSGHSGVRRWTRKVDIFAYDVIPIPVHVGGVHWCMAIIHLKNKTIKYYDSMGTPNPRVLQALEHYLRDESLDKKKQTFDTTHFLKESVPDVPRQMNGSDCGVFSCMFAEYITRDRGITFSQQNMQYFRQKMILEIVKGILLL